MPFLDRTILVRCTATCTRRKSPGPKACVRFPFSRYKRTAEGGQFSIAWYPTSRTKKTNKKNRTHTLNANILCCSILCSNPFPIHSYSLPWTASFRLPSPTHAVPFPLPSWYFCGEVAKKTDLSQILTGRAQLTSTSSSSFSRTLPHRANRTKKGHLNSFATWKVMHSGIYRQKDKVKIQKGLGALQSGLISD